MSNGNVQGLYQDFHIEKALEDSTQSGARYLQIEVSGSGGPSSGGSSAPAPQASAPRTTSTPAKAGNVIPETRFIFYSNSTQIAPATGSSPSPTNRKLEENFGVQASSLGGSPASGGASKCLHFLCFFCFHFNNFVIEFCGNCGAAASGAKFCPECGSPQGGAAPAQSKPASTPAPAQSKPSGNGCAACGGAMGLTSVQAMNTNWHKECFVCQNCRKSLLEEGFKNVNNLPMCGGCYNNQFGLKCNACKRVIDGEYVQVAGQPFHRECYG